MRYVQIDDWLRTADRRPPPALWSVFDDLPDAEPADLPRVVRSAASPSREVVRAASYERDEAVVRLLADAGPLSIADVIDRLGSTRGRVQGSLHRLRVAGRIAPSGHAHLTRWSVVPA